MAPRECKIIAGISSIDLSPLEPLAVGYMNLVQTNGSVTIDAISKDAHITGFSNATFTKFKGFDKNLLELELKAPILTFSGNYKLKAKFLGLTMSGEGEYLNVYSND